MGQILNQRPWADLCVAEDFGVVQKTSSYTKILPIVNPLPTKSELSEMRRSMGPGGFHRASITKELAPPRLFGFVHHSLLPVVSDEVVTRSGVRFRLKALPLDQQTPSRVKIKRPVKQRWAQT